MLIRAKGYNDGAREYLEEGVKNGRELSRDELDERIILDGDLELTQMVYQSIPDNGQDRYTSFTLAFYEDEVPEETLQAVVSEFKAFMMYAYDDDEYNFYAEAHIPKIRELPDKKTGNIIERKPHVHIIIPTINLLSGDRISTVGNYKSNEKYFEAFQEYLNQKYHLVSPREKIRAKTNNVADILSRYKGDDFLPKNREFKEGLVANIIDRNITSREGFYQHVASYGETRIRNKGKENEYIAVKLPDDRKFTNLKETIFRDDFIVRRELKKPPLDKAVISQRLNEWADTASKYIKYRKKIGNTFGRKYNAASPADRPVLLSQAEHAFYEKYRGNHELRTTGGERSQQRSVAEAGSETSARAAGRLQGVPGGNVAADGAGQRPDSPLLLPGDARLRLGSEEPGGNAGLRHAVPEEEGRRARAGGTAHATASRVPGRTAAEFRSGGAGPGNLAGGIILPPPYARNPWRRPGVNDIRQRSRMLFGARGDVRSTEVSLRTFPAPAVDPRSNSFIASLLRRHEMALLPPEDRREIRAIDQQYYQACRMIKSDNRLTATEKQQYTAVLLFERMKQQQRIKNPHEKELTMSSDDIRNMYKESTGERPENSIGGPEAETPVSARNRFAKILRGISETIDRKNDATTENSQKEARHLTASDLYPKRGKLTGNIHYMDKKDDKTLFVDTGKFIAVRKENMSDSSVTLALELAKSKFGSTLSIKGDDDFKNKVIEAVARNNMDIHFTDKEMNQKLADRRTELDAEAGGQHIEPESTVNTDVSDNTGTEVNKTQPENNAEPDNSEPESTAKVLYGTLQEHGPAPYQFKAKNTAENYYVKLKMDDGNTRTLWGVGLSDAMKGLRPGDEIRIEDKGTHQVNWTETDKDGVTVEKSGERRVWEAEPTDWERSQERQAELSSDNNQNTDGPGVD